ncbi:MAG: Spy/CpxP family protein refolding chaperone [bacterium]
MKRVLALVLSLALLLGTVQVAFTKPLPSRRIPIIAGPFRCDIVEISPWGQNLIKYLNLTDEQINKIKELRDRYYGKLKDLWNKLQDAVFSLRQLQFQRQPDKTQIEEKRKEISNIRKEINNTLKDYWNEFKGILTKEQLSKLTERKFTPPFRIKRTPWRCSPFFRW